MNICRKIVNNTHFESISFFFIVLTVCLLTLATEFITSKWNIFFRIADFTLGGVFIVEYSIRLGASQKFTKVFKPMMVLDLIVILSLFYPYHYNLSFLRLLKLFHLFRSRRFQTAKVVIKRVVATEKEELIMLFSFFFLMVFILSALTYFFEGNANTFNSIPKCIYWVMITATSVGYGDVVPFTVFGKIIAIIAATMGLATYSMMTAIFASGFTTEMKKLKK